MWWKERWNICISPLCFQCHETLNSLQLQSWLSLISEVIRVSPVRGSSAQWSCGSVSAEGPVLVWFHQFPFCPVTAARRTHKSLCAQLESFIQLWLIPLVSSPPSFSTSLPLSPLISPPPCRHLPLPLLLTHTNTPPLHLLCLCVPQSNSLPDIGVQMGKPEVKTSYLCMSVAVFPCGSCLIPVTSPVR